MGIYTEQVLPRLIDKACGTKSVGRWRSRVTEGLTGVVVEPGFGSGNNLPFYPKEVTRVYAVDPAVVGRKLAAAFAGRGRVHWARRPEDPLGRRYLRRRAADVHVVHHRGSRSSSGRASAGHQAPRSPVLCRARAGREPVGAALAEANRPCTKAPVRWLSREP